MKNRIVMNATLAPRVKKQTPPSAAPFAERSAASAPVSKSMVQAPAPQTPPVSSAKPKARSSESAAPNRRPFSKTAQTVKPSATPHNFYHPAPAQKPQAPAKDHFYRFPERETLVLSPQPEPFAAPPLESVPVAPRAFHALAAVRAQQQRILSRLPPQ